MRPKIIPGTPLEYKELIEQCWNAYPEKRPDINTLVNKISEINRLNYQNESNENQKEQEAFHSNPYGFSIPYNIEDFDNKSNNNISKSSNLFNGK
ncbi:unnamed protein product [Rhizophagus irregularis]|nr:unnamed protein product [Rhizophagus irregularis]